MLLGIAIDDKLSFDKHVSTLFKKAARQLNVLCHLNHLLDEKKTQQNDYLCNIHYLKLQLLSLNVVLLWCHKHKQHGTNPKRIYLWNSLRCILQ